MSFTAKIDFLDADGNRFSVPVTGATDNSLCCFEPGGCTPPLAIPMATC